MPCSEVCGVRTLALQDDLVGFGVISFRPLLEDLTLCLQDQAKEAKIPIEKLSNLPVKRYMKLRACLGQEQIEQLVCLTFASRVGVMTRFTKEQVSCQSSMSSISVLHSPLFSDRDSCSRKFLRRGTQPLKPCSLPLPATTSRSAKVKRRDPRSPSGLLRS